MNDKPNPTNGAAPLPDAAAKTPEQWREYCAELLAEVERLKAETVEWREERAGLVQMIPIPEDVKALAGKSYEELMTTCGGQETLEDIIGEFEKKHGS